MILFTILIASFLISNYFNKHDLNDDLKYKNKDYYKTGFIFSLLGWNVLFVNLFIDYKFLYYVGMIILSLSLIKEIIFSVLRINYYNKSIKQIKSDNRLIIKREMEIDSIKRIFFLLASPLLIVERMINYLLNKIF